MMNEFINSQEYKNLNDFYSAEINNNNNDINEKKSFKLFYNDLKNEIIKTNEQIDKDYEININENIKKEINRKKNLNETEKLSKLFNNENEYISFDKFQNIIKEYNKNYIRYKQNLKKYIFHENEEKFICILVIIKFEKKDFDNNKNVINLIKILN